LLLLVHPQSADAAIDLHPFDDPGVLERLDDLPKVDLHPPDLAPALHILPTDTYGTGDPQVEEKLAAATSGEAAALVGDQLATDSDSHSDVDRCAADAFKAAADDYKKALISNLLNPSKPSWPNFEEEFDSAISACLEVVFRNAPRLVLAEGSHYVATQAAGYAENALGADSAAAVFARWMNVTAGSAERAAEAAENTSTPEPSPKGSSGHSSSIPIIIGVITVAAFIIFLSSRSRKRKL
jgi:hypothetical protein